MTPAIAPSPSADRFRRRALLIVIVAGLLATLLGWYVMAARAPLSAPLMVELAVTTIVLSLLLLAAWLHWLPQRLLELGCLLYTVAVCLVCMALRMYAPRLGAGIHMQTLYLWVPIVYVFAFMLTSHKAGLALSLAILALFVAVSAPYLVYEIDGRYANFTVQMLVVSGAMIAMLYFFSSYQHRLRLAEAAVGKFANLSNTDDLTGLANRRRVVTEINAALARFAWGAGGFAVLLFDVDHFKTVNDQFGHTVGDAVLKALAERAAAVFGGAGVLGRWGGDEFVVAARGIRAEQAQCLAVALCARVAAAPLAGIQHVTVSCGVTVARLGDSLDSVLQRADAALYAAKRAGRNRAESLVEPETASAASAASATPASGGPVEIACVERLPSLDPGTPPDAARNGVRRRVRH